MNLLLAQRSKSLMERMDDPHCDLEKLYQTYRRFQDVNRQLSQWNRLYKHILKPQLTKWPNLSILDLGCGGGDVTHFLLKQAQQDGFTPKITGADPDARAIEFAQEHFKEDDLTFTDSSAKDLLENDASFNIVISNHVMHHLEPSELLKFARIAKSLTTNLVLFNDIHRSDLAYLFFHIYTTGRFKNSFIREDGLASIRRSYTVNELRVLLGPNWNTFALFPFRLIALYDHSTS